MTRAIEILMGEHRLIEQVLGSLETYVVGIEQGLPPERRTLADYAAFFRGFADACHHGKEEDILFQRMLERGMPRQTGPLAVMFHEHVLGRARVAALRGLGEADGPFAPVEVQLAVENASGVHRAAAGPHPQGGRDPLPDGGAAADRARARRARDGLRGVREDDAGRRVARPLSRPGRRAHQPLPARPGSDGRGREHGRLPRRAPVAGTETSGLPTSPAQASRQRKDLTPKKNARGGCPGRYRVKRFLES